MISVKYLPPREGFKYPPTPEKRNVQLPKKEPCKPCIQARALARKLFEKIKPK